MEEDWSASDPFVIRIYVILKRVPAVSRLMIKRVPASYEPMIKRVPAVSRLMV